MLHWCLETRQSSVHECFCKGKSDFENEAGPRRHTFLWRELCAHNHSHTNSHTELRKRTAKLAHTHTHTHTHTQAGCVDGSVCVSKEKESRGKSCRCEAASSPWSAQGPFSSILRLHNGIGNLPASYSNFLCPISMLRCLLWNLLSSMSGLYYYYYYNKTIYTGHICSMKIPPLYTTKW